MEARNREEVLAAVLLKVDCGLKMKSKKAKAKERTSMVKS